MDVSMRGRPRKFVWGHIVSGRPITPPVVRGVIGGSETLCPRTTFLGPLVPKINIP